MKKILCILIAVINLFACTQKEITVTVENLPVEDIPEEVLSYAETICSEGICAIGTGIRLNELKEGDILPSDATLFPLYRNGESDRFLLVRDKEYFTVPAQDIEEDGAFSVLLVDDSVYLVRKDGITPLVNGDIQAIGKEKAVQKLQECAMAKNPLGRKRRIVRSEEIRKG